MASSGDPASVVIRPICRNSICQKRTVLSVMKSGRDDGRFYWRCPIHGWSKCSDEKEDVQTHARGGDIMHGELLCEFVQPRHQVGMRNQATRVSSTRVSTTSDEVVGNVQTRQKKKRVEQNEDKYMRIRQLVCMNLLLLAIYLVVQIVRAFE